MTAPLPASKEAGKKNCDRKECPNLARWQLGIRLYGAPKGTPQTAPAEGLFSLYICDQHKEKTTRSELVTDAAFAQLVNAFKRAGKAAPILEETEIFFEELT